MSMKNIMTITILLLSTTIPVCSLTIDLMDVWRASQSIDPSFISSRFEQLAGEQRLEQSRSLWLPNIYLTATKGKMASNTVTKGAEFNAPGLENSFSNATFNTRIRNGVVNRHMLLAVQPLYDLQRLMQSRQLSLSANISNLLAESSKQDLILLVAESYFTMLLAEETLRLIKKQEEVVKKTYKEISKRFNLGDAAQTDLQESAERLDSIKVKVIEADTELKIKKLALKDLLGIIPQDWKKLKNILINCNFLNSLDHYIVKMKSQNPQLLIMANTLDIAKHEAKKHSAISSVKVEAIAQLSRDSLRGHSNNSNYTASNTLSNHLFGVQLSVPIFTGGYRSAKEAEAIWLIEKSKAEYDKAMVATEQAIRILWFELSASTNRMHALQNNLQTSQARLISTIKGHAVGARSTLEVLLAQSDAINAEHALYKDKVNALLNRLRLNAIIGELTEDKLKIINNYLQ
jgi:outer membrane protein